MFATFLLGCRAYFCGVEFALGRCSGGAIDWDVLPQAGSFQHLFPFTCVRGPSILIKEPFVDSAVSLLWDLHKGGGVGGGGGGCRARSPLGIQGGPGLLRGCLPGVGLLLLTERSIILTPVCILHLGRRMRTIKRNSSCLILYLWERPCTL